MTAVCFRLGVVLSAALVMPLPANAQPAPPVDAPSQIGASSSADGDLTNVEQPGVAPTAPVKAWTPSFPQLFGSLGGDFRQLTTSNAFLIVGIGGSAAFGAHAFDRRIATSGWGGESMSEALGPGRIVGGMLVQSSAALATYLTGRATGSARLAQVGAELTRAQIVAQGITQTIKISTQRTRPDGTPLSFPSGHTASSFATATILEREFGWKVGIPAYFGAAWVAASRVQAERHYLSDVVAGATVGILAGRAVTVGRGDNRFSLAPMAVPGGIGFSFTRARK